MRRVALLAVLLALSACAGPTEPEYHREGLTCTLHQLPDGTITDYGYCR